ncbi:hypothetical protein ACROYT_G026472 [Oculina patagonica]
MNSILFCLFIFTFCSLGAKIPKDINKSEASKHGSAESLGQRSSADYSISQDDASLTTKRDVRRTNTDPWLKLNSRPVCFGAKYSQYGRFSAYDGKIAGIKLVHQSGYVSCKTGNVYHYSFWGCGSHTHLKNHVNVVITTSSNHAILPLSQFVTQAAGMWSEIPGYNSMSPEIALPFFSLYSVHSGQQLRLWYGEDLAAWYEDDNGGRVCCDVYALYV